MLVANRRSGSLSLIDLAARKIVAEHKVGRGLADLADIPGSPFLFAVEQGANEVLLIGYQDRAIRVVDRRKVSPDPVRMVVSNDGSRCIVASLWSRELTFLALAPRISTRKLPTITIVGSLDLPFCPRELALHANWSQVNCR